MLAVSKLTGKGQTTIPQDVRVALKIVAGDLIAWEMSTGGSATVRRVQPMDMAHLRVAEGALSEWAGAADEAAYSCL